MNARTDTENLRALSHYTLQAKLAENRGSGFEPAFDALADAVARGENRMLRLDLMSARNEYPVSSFLGECSETAQALLFRACHLATATTHPNVTAEQAQRAAFALREFVQQVAMEYAQDNAGVYE